MLYKFWFVDLPSITAIIKIHVNPPTKTYIKYHHANLLELYNLHLSVLINLSICGLPHRHCNLHCQEVDKVTAITVANE